MEETEDMDITPFLGKDVTLHTGTHKYRGVLKAEANNLIHLEMGIDDFFINSFIVDAVTVHGLERGVDD